MAIDPSVKGGTDVLTRSKNARPPLYRVVFHNDDFTTCEFVVMVLRRFFYKPETEALSLMRRIHQQGQGVAGVYPYDVAVSKKQQVEQLARSQKMPLRLTVEQESAGSEGN